MEGKGLEDYLSGECYSDEEGEKIIDVTPEKLEELRKIITDPKMGMPKRFRTIFTLRNIGGPKSIDILVQGALLKF